MSGRIILGVSAFFIYPDPQRPFFGHKTAVCLESDMARYLARPGVMPVLIPDLETARLEGFLGDMDGFILQGGADVSPETYGHKHLDPKKWPGDPYRDRYEMRILDYAVARGKPVLGICRGCQLINVYFGGTLYQDLGTELSGSRTHRDAALYDQVHHPIAFESGGILARVYADDVKDNPDPRVNSVHHQGIRDLAQDLRPEAVCPDDGLIEAVAHKDLEKTYVLGVQWHPEFSHTTADAVIPPEPLYDHFLSEVVRRKKTS